MSGFTASSLGHSLVRSSEIEAELSLTAADWSAALQEGIMKAGEMFFPEDEGEGDEGLRQHTILHVSLDNYLKLSGLLPLADGSSRYKFVAAIINGALERICTLVISPESMAAVPAEIPHFQGSADYALSVNRLIQFKGMIAYNDPVATCEEYRKMYRCTICSAIQPVPKVKPSNYDTQRLSLACAMCGVWTKNGIVAEATRGLYRYTKGQLIIDDQEYNFITPIDMHSIPEQSRKVHGIGIPMPVPAPFKTQYLHVLSLKSADQLEALTDDEFIGSFRDFWSHRGFQIPTGIRDLAHALAPDMSCNLFPKLAGIIAIVHGSSKINGWQPQIMSHTCPRNAIAWSDVEGRDLEGLKQTYKGHRNVHVLFAGDKRTGKSTIAKACADMARQSSIVNCPLSSIPDVLGSVQCDDLFRFTSPGALIRAGTGICYMDEFGSLEKTGNNPLRQPMEEGFIKATKAGSNEMRQLRASIIATTIYDGRSPWDMPEKRIPMSETTLDRFTLVLDVPEAPVTNLISHIRRQRDKNMEHVEVDVGEARLDLSRVLLGVYRHPCSQMTYFASETFYDYFTAETDLYGTLATAKHANMRQMCHVERVISAVGALNGCFCTNVLHVAVALLCREASRYGLYGNREKALKVFDNIEKSSVRSNEQILECIADVTGGSFPAWKRRYDEDYNVSAYPDFLQRLAHI